MSDKKQTAVQWLVTQLNLEINYIPMDYWDRIRDLVQQALQMEREQIEDVAMYHRDSAVEIDCIRSYMKKNYRGQDESNN